MDENQQSTPLQDNNRQESNVVNAYPNESVPHESPPVQSQYPSPVTTSIPPLQTTELDTTSPSQTKKSKARLYISILVILILVVVGSLVLLDRLTGQGIDAAAKCFSIEAAKSEENQKKMAATESREERLTMFCKNDEERFNRLISCLEQVRNQNSLSMGILEAFPKYKNTIQETVDSHNQTCPDSPISLP